MARHPVISQRGIARVDEPEQGPGFVAGHRVRRLIGSEDPAFSDPFLLMGEDWMPHGAYSVHPHRGIETVTYVISGVLDHHDSAGQVGRLTPGDVQWMTAGRGVLHEESAPLGGLAHTLQLWVNLPAAAKMAEPRYQHLRAADMPRWQTDGAQVTVFSGQSRGVSAPTLNHVPVTMLDVQLDAGSKVTIDLDGEDNAFFFVLDGAALAGAEEIRMSTGQIVWLTHPDQPCMTQLTLRTDATPVRLLLFAGKPLREPVVFGGPFVMNTAEEIRQAHRDFALGTFSSTSQPDVVTQPKGNQA
jgi:quercetin 2,3-dioxygenase